MRAEWIPGPGHRTSIQSSPVPYFVLSLDNTFGAITVEVAERAQPPHATPVDCDLGNQNGCNRIIATHRLSQGRPDMFLPRTFVMRTPNIREISDEKAFFRLAASGNSLRLV